MTERWADVIDVNMRRADVLEDTADRIKVYRGVADIWRGSNWGFRRRSWCL